MGKIMHNFDCRSVFDNREANFHQLNAVIKSARSYIKMKEASTKVSTFEVPSKLIIPLQNLDDNITALFKETETKVNEEQQYYLIHCKRAIATFYCWIQFFFESLVDSKPTPNTRRLTFEFYLNVHYELRTPYYLLKAYAQSQEFAAETKELEKFNGQIYSSPFVPENQDKVERISYWSKELGKFMDDLPRLGREFSDEDSA